jgi:hypothetical protein
MVTVDFGQGLRAFGAGHFESIAGVPVVAFAEWGGTAWMDPGLGFTSSSMQRTEVYAMAAHDCGLGYRLFIAGDLFHPSLVPNIASGAYRGIIEWDGVTIRTIGAVGGGVSDMVSFDSGGGPTLVVAGPLTSVGGVLVSGAAMWDGATWSPLGIGIGPISGYPRVNAAAVFDEGQGPRLFVAGEFFMAGGLFADSIARWDGTAWSAVDWGLTSNFCPYVYDLAVYDDGAGSALYATGTFDSAGLGFSIPVGNIARWDGANWDDLGGGFSVSTFAAAVHDDGDGEALFVGGGGHSVNGIPICGVSRYGPVRRPTLFVQQDAPNFPIYVQHAGLQQGSEYFNVFSADVCPTTVPGSGPLLGLCATDPQPLISQILLPVGAVPFHYLGGSAPSQTFGPYMIPPATFDFLSIEFRNGGLWSASHVARFTVQ